MHTTIRAICRDPHCIVQSAASAVFPPYLSRLSPEDYWLFPEKSPPATSCLLGYLSQTLLSCCQPPKEGPSVLTRDVASTWMPCFASSLRNPRAPGEWNGLGGAWLKTPLPLKANQLIIHPSLLDPCKWMGIHCQLALPNPPVTRGKIKKAVSLTSPYITLYQGWKQPLQVSYSEPGTSSLLEGP